MSKKQKKQAIQKTRRPGKVSAKLLYERGELGVSKPIGKPNDMSMSDYVKSILSIVKGDKTLGDQILEKQAMLAANGNSKAAEFLFDRAYGKPLQSVSVTNPPQVVVEHNVINIDDIPPIQ